MKSPVLGPYQAQGPSLQRCWASIKVWPQAGCLLRILSHLVLSQQPQGSLLVIEGKKLDGGERVPLEWVPDAKITHVTLTVTDFGSCQQLLQTALQSSGCVSSTHSWNVVCARGQRSPVLFLLIMNYENTPVLSPQIALLPHPGSCLAPLLSSSSQSAASKKQKTSFRRRISWGFEADLFVIM